jgi:hypothetical protein
MACSLSRLGGHRQTRNRRWLCETIRLLGLDVGLDPRQRPATESFAQGSGQPIEQTRLD